MNAVTGKTTRSLAERDKLSFSFSGSLDNVTGSGVFGLSGQTQNLEFLFKKGRIYDPEDKYFNSYTESEIVQISGNISGSKYDYYFNNEPVNFNGVRTNEKVKSFYLDVTGCQIDTDVKILSDKYLYNFVFPDTFVTGAPWTGTLSSTNASDTFEIFSGTVYSPTTWHLTGFDAGRLTTASVKLQPTDESVSSNIPYVVDFVLYTNFGEINRTVTGTSAPADAYDGSTFQLSGYDGNAGLFSGASWGSMSAGVPAWSASSQLAHGDNHLDYSLIHNNTGITEKPIIVKVTNNQNSTGNFITGYTITGVQLRGENQNGFFLDTPTVTFNSKDSNDVQASGEALMADYMVADFPNLLSPSTPLTGIVVKTVTGVKITNSGSYTTPTGVGVSFSHPTGLGVAFPQLFYTYDYIRLPLQASQAGVRYETSDAYSNKYSYYDPSRPNENLANEVRYTSNIGAIALATSGTGSHSRNFTGTWQVLTGTYEQMYKWNTGWNSYTGVFGSYSTGVLADGNQVNQNGEYYSSGKMTEDYAEIRLISHIPQNKIGISTTNELTIQPDNNYQSNYGTATVPVDYYSFFPELTDLISGTLYAGGQGSIDLTYSFVKSGTAGVAEDGSTVATYGDLAYTSMGTEPSLSFTGITGEVVSAFGEWKNLLETTYTGLTINFVNNGQETGTSVPVAVGGATYAMPHPEEANIGDIRIGMISGNADTALGWTIVTGGTLNVSGDEISDISFNQRLRFRLDSDTTNTGTCYSLKHLTAHEIGHALGLGHDRDKSGIMYYSLGTDDTFSQNFPNGLSGSLRNQDLIRNFYSFSKDPTHVKWEEKKNKGFLGESISANLYISGLGQTPINQIISGISPSGFVT